MVAEKQGWRERSHVRGFGHVAGGVEEQETADRKPRKERKGWWVPGKGGVGVMIWAVCPGLLVWWRTHLEML
jgi:hypothetical protein